MNDTTAQTPYSAETYQTSHGESGWCVKSGDYTVFDLPFGAGWTKKQVKANAAFIVRACNAHEALTEALGMLIDATSDNPKIKFIDALSASRSTLALARGES